MAQFIPPNYTIYIRNISEKVHRDELIKSLWAIFQQFGEILDICARPKKQNLRGQAWIVFRDVNSATGAMRQMQGYSFHGEPLGIQFSKQKSDAIAKLDGTYVERKKPREKRKRKGVPDEPRKRGARGGQGKNRKPEENAPHNVLFVEQLPDSDDNVQMLTVLFQNFQGFREVRMPPGPRTLAFVEFDNEPSASHAMTNLQGFRISAEHSLRITYAKK
eukprot:NODE_2399_length_791_cov_245.556604_g1670_i0.p1 GENE.NODE_2399_length_791_cov_245.556604_g1670_i0~~NODE_2399_length_791_cov_245.556604_g1670_i0.p1  ORF type:complete len:218 (-),score=71.14 NODE_2399_length_791_cov_245.556604_g1670_i0:79-732(-)